jgi:DNA-binding transcriptional MocR family regulator
MAIAGLRAITIPSDQEGIRPDDLQKILEVHRPKLVYLTGAVNQPTGRTWSIARRDAIAGVLERFPTLVVEDGSLAATASRATSPTLKSVDNTGNVIFLCSYSKMTFPALRVATATCSPTVAGRLAEAIHSLVRLQPALSQIAFARYAATDRFQADFAKSMRTYARRRDALIAGLTSSAALKVNPTTAGFSIWLKLPEGLSGEVCCFALKQKKILALPADIFLLSPNNYPAIRLAFSQNSEADLEKSGVIIANEIEKLSDQATDLGMMLPTPP